ncbi:hypothetical protein [Aquimarina sediminis]|uniref:hypothetical protein n=1 Tax=Aquimarina sediminis TaxID=2070536 RepID=UPI000FFE9D7F|nr:hypothetical protein [Aquimarina sediminis]
MSGRQGDEIALLKIEVEENKGLERSLEYIIINLPRLKPSQKDYQLFAYSSNNKVKTPVQIVGSKLSTKDNHEIHGVLPISIRGNETKEYVIKAEPNKGVKTDTDLAVKGNHLDLIVENKYYAASLKEYIGHKHQKFGSGHLGSLTLKEFDNVVLARKNPSLKIHWAPNFSKENLDYKTMAHLNSPDSIFVSTKGPFYFSLFRSGYIKGYEKILLKGKYKFYSGLPYFTFESEITFTKDDSLNLLRNDEMTIDSLFTHLAFLKARGNTIHLPLYDENSIACLDKNPISDDSPWLFFYNKYKSFAFGTIRLLYDNKNIHGDYSPTDNRHTKITASTNNGRYWNRRLIDSANTFVPKGSKYTEKNAYIIFKIDKKDPEKRIKYFYERLKNPVIVRYIQ